MEITSAVKSNPKAIKSCTEGPNALGAQVITALSLSLYTHRYMYIYISCAIFMIFDLLYFVENQVDVCAETEGWFRF